MSANCEPSSQIAKFTEDILKKVALVKKLKECKITEASEIHNKGENYLGVVSRLTVQGVKENGEKEDVRLFVKVPPEGADIRKYMPINRVYKRECQVYTNLLPVIDKIQQDSDTPKDQQLKFAQCFTSNYEDLGEILVFEDLTTLDYRNYNRLKPLDYDHIMLVIKTIARYHALSFALKKKNQKTFKELKEISFALTDYGTMFGEVVIHGLVDGFIPHISDPDKREKIKKFREGDLAQKFTEYLDLDNKKEDTYKILCHGDCWSNNILFNYEEEKPVKAVLIDWQMLLYGFPVGDLFYSIFSATDGDFRRKHLEELWDTYYKTLELALSEIGLDAGVVYPRKIFRQHIHDMYPMSFLYSVLLIPTVLTKKEEVIDLADVVDEDGGVDMTNMKFSEECIVRLEEVVNELIEGGFV